MNTNMNTLNSTASEKSSEKSSEKKEEFVAWWQAYLAIYAALQLDDTRDENERQRTATERADQVMRSWHTRRREMLDPESASNADVARQIYLQAKARAEAETKSNVSEVSGVSEVKVESKSDPSIADANGTTS